MKTTAIRAVALFALVWTAVAGGRPAAAASPEAERESRRHFQAAETRFRAGEFAEALAEYQAGYDALPLSGFLINMAQCERRMGDLKKARAFYAKFLLVAPDSPLVPEVRGLVSELDHLIADLGENNAPTAKRGAELSSGLVSGTAGGAIAAGPPGVAAGDGASVSDRTAAMLTAPAAPPESPRPVYKRWWFWGAIGASVAVGAAVAILASSGSSDTIHSGSLGTLRPAP